MKTYGHILDFLTTQIWAVDFDKLNAIVSVLNARYLSLEGLAYEAKERPQASNEGGGLVAVLPLFGTISRRASIMSESSGGASIESFTKQFRAAMADPEIGSILINIDSPGGGVHGVPEVASEIMRSRGRKRIVAVANAMSASAAYWIGTAAEEFYVSPSGQVGSIGVFAVHVDRSENNAKEGLKPTYISAGKFKVEGNPDAPLDTEAAAALQKNVDAYYNMFVKSVAKGRNVKVEDVKEGFGEGRMVMAEEAQRLGMVDGVATYDDVLSSMVNQTSKRRQVRAEVERAHLQANKERIDLQVAAIMANSGSVGNVVFENNYLGVAHEALEAGEAVTSTLDDEERIKRLAALEAE